MNSDIRLKVSFRDHIKRQKLQRRLGAEGVLAFIDLLLYAAQNRPDGVLSGMNEEDIALAACWSGPHEQLVTILVELRLLDIEGDVYAIHEWHDHNPYAAGAKERSEKARKAANAKWSYAKSCSEHCSTGAVAETSNALLSSSPSLLSSSPSPEEKKNEVSTPRLSPPAADDGNEDQTVDRSPDCPQRELVELYNRTLPELPQVKAWGDAEARHLRSRWREDRARQNIAWWSRFFQLVRESPFLLGQNDKGWSASLAWMVMPINFNKILNGQYHRNKDKAARRYGQKGLRNAAAIAEWLIGQGADDEKQESVQ